MYFVAASIFLRISDSWTILSKLRIRSSKSLNWFSRSLFFPTRWNVWILASILPRKCAIPAKVYFLFDVVVYLRLSSRIRLRIAFSFSVQYPISVSTTCSSRSKAAGTICIFPADCSISSIALHSTSNSSVTPECELLQKGHMPSGPESVFNQVDISSRWSWTCKDSSYCPMELRSWSISVCLFWRAKSWEAISCSSLRSSTNSADESLIFEATNWVSVSAFSTIASSCWTWSSKLEHSLKWAGVSPISLACANQLATSCFHPSETSLIVLISRSKRSLCFFNLSISCRAARTFGVTAPKAYGKILINFCLCSVVSAL